MGVVGLYGCYSEIYLELYYDLKSKVLSMRLTKKKNILTSLRIV